MPLTQEECFFKLKFKPEQISAIRELYYKHIASIAKGYVYIGHAILLTWRNGTNEIPAFYPIDGSHNQSTARIGYAFNFLKNDPLWQHFNDILPYMSETGSLTVMPPFSVMVPHCDRPTRPNAIYFPISEGRPNSINDFYDLPKVKDSQIHSTYESHIPKFSYEMMNDAYLMNPHEWHGVRNYTQSTRIVFGWNCKGGDNQKSFFELVEIFKSLNYIQ